MEYFDAKKWIDDRSGFADKGYLLKNIDWVFKAHGSRVIDCETIDIIPILYVDLTVSEIPEKTTLEDLEEYIESKFKKEITPHNVLRSDLDECVDPSGLTRKEIDAIMDDITSEQNE